VTGDRRRLRKEELQDLHSTPNIIQFIKSGRLILEGHVACKGESKSACRVLVGKPVRKGQLGRSRYRQEDNIKNQPSESGIGH
jgi:hypothetical protein